MITPKGGRIDLEVRDNVPYLPDGPEDMIRREATKPAFPSEVQDPAVDDAFASHDEPLDDEGDEADDGPMSPQHLLTHHPKDPRCPTCQRTKLSTKPARRHVGPDRDKPTTFGELVTADHMVMGPSDAGRNNERSALVILDRGSKWLQCYPLPDKSSDATIRAFTAFLGVRETVQMFFTATTHKS
jgi:hypothetical protein